jgi:hypothetical protein
MQRDKRSHLPTSEELAISNAYLNLVRVHFYLSQLDLIHQSIMAVIAWYKTAMPLAFCELRIVPLAFSQGRNCNNVDLWQTTRHGL